jgi:phosphohistidine swiveling domain-containing protein
MMHAIKRSYLAGLKYAEDTALPAVVPTFGSDPKPVILDQNCSATRLTAMGGKAANLHRMSRHGVRIPKWVCLSSHVCAAAFDENQDAIQRFLNAIDYQRQESIQRACDGIRDLIQRTPVDDTIRRNVARALNKLGGSCFAVRSSGLAEDSSVDSHAGLFDTFLYVDRADVIDRIRSCWASAFTPGNLVYAQRRGGSSAPRPVAVVIQVMVDSEAAGVMFMANPSGDLDETVIVAGYGLGEGIVSGQVETDTYIFDRTRVKWRCEIGDKRKSVRLDIARGHGTSVEEVTQAKRHKPVLSIEQREMLREQGESIARLYDEFQDIEWAFDSTGILYITQSRAITTIPQGTQRIFDNSNIVESYPGVTSPLTVSHIRHCYEVLFRNTLLRLGVSKKGIRQHNHAFKNMLGYLGGRVYYNLSNWYQMFSLVPGVEPYLPVWEEMLGIQKQTDRVPTRWLKRIGQLPRLLWVASRVLWFFVSLSFYMNRCARSFRRIESDVRARSIAEMESHELAELHDYLEAEVLHGWEITLLNDLYAFVFTAAVRRQLRHIGLDENVFGGLMAGDNELESTAPVRAATAMAEAVRRDPVLCQQLQDVLALPAEDLGLEHIERLIDRPAFVRDFRNQLERFGDRCPEELKLESKCFRDDPQSLLRLISTYAASSVTVQQLDEQRFGTQANAAAGLRTALRGRPVRRVLLGCTLSLARRSIRYRESSRLDRARAFGLIRSIFSSLGKNLAGEGFLGEPRDVFYLTTDEVLGFVTGASVDSRLQGLIAQRKSDLDGYRAFSPAERIRTQGIVRAMTVPLKTRSTGGASNGGLQGKGVSAGVATAAAAVVHRPAEAGDVEGKVLVAEMTDPGWVFLMASAAALVVEKGSLLSHTAIIGRELGVPTVVGVAGATDLIKSGQVLQVNGQTGEIRWKNEGRA